MTREADRDTIDLGDIPVALRRGWRWIVAGVVGGLLLAGVATLLLPVRYEGLASVLLRSGAQPASGFGGSDSEGILSLGGLANVLSGVTGFDTELEILTSRSVMGAVVDSLGLQATVGEPDATAPTGIFAAASWDPDLRDGVYQFERAGDVYRVSGPGATGPATPGEPYRLAGSVFTLRTEGLPDQFGIELVDRQDAIDQFEERLDAEQARGDVAELTFHAPDPHTAAAAPNALVTQYLVHRRITDRGINQRRYEFLAAHTDSTREELARAEQALRRQQEESGVFDPAMFGETELERGLELGAELDAVEVEARAFRDVLAEASSGTLSPRSLAAYPTFLSNPAINNLLSRLQTLETERTALLDRRTERDPDVMVLDEQIEQLEGQLVSLSRSYLDGLNQQRAELRAELARYGAVLDQLPAQAEAHYRAERQVRRLSETLVALQTQLVQARLAAIGEGGEVRQIDMAVPPEDPAFPKPLLNLAIGLIGGLMFGMVGALGRYYLGNRIHDARDAELASGVPAIMLDSRMPLLLGRGNEPHSVLVIPASTGASSAATARRIAGTAALQGTSVVLADLETTAAAIHPSDTVSDAGVAVTGTGQTVAASLEAAGSGESGGYLVYQGRENGGANPGIRAVLGELEHRFALVVTALPPLGESVTTALLTPDRPVVVVVRAGATSRSELRQTVTALDRFGVSVAGVIVHNGSDGDRRA